MCELAVISPPTNSIYMKNILILSSTILLIVGCNQNTVECPEVDMSTYEKNQATVERMFAGFQNGEIDPSIYASDFIEVGTGFNENDRGKEETMEQYRIFTSLLSMDLQEEVYLPGVDSVNYEVDGSVRYYGQWQMQMGEATQKLMTYGSFEFNEAGEMTTLAHYADWTATFNALLAENPEIMEQMMQAAE
ncbi:MAG TPA: hypothetical protein DD635_02845 [Flavobacteriales bacterium]|nr:hypothetical protein [Flavobacteriales bacterium]|tara:strand:- start:7338 stop:7910 length:573 start_codon:yes stop_codon:yes gene_type:complete